MIKFLPISFLFLLNIILFLTCVGWQCSISANISLISHFPIPVLSRLCYILNYLLISGRNSFHELFQCFIGHIAESSNCLLNNISIVYLFKVSTMLSFWPSSYWIVHLTPFGISESLLAMCLQGALHTCMQEFSKIMLTLQHAPFSESALYQPKV